LIQKKAGFGPANDKHEEKFAKYEKASKFGKASKEEASWKSAEKNLKNARGEITTVEDYISGKQTEIAKLESSLRDNLRAQAEASAPKHPVTPIESIPIINAEKSSKYTHLFHKNDQGEKQSLGKYDTPEKAQLVAGAYSSLQTGILDLGHKGYQGQNQLLDQEVHINNIPKPPAMVVPVLSGTDADANYRIVVNAIVQNKKSTTSYLNGLSEIAKKPIQVTGISTAELRDLAKQITPDVTDAPLKPSKPRKPKTVAEKTWHWIKENVVVSGEMRIGSIDLYKTPPPNTTPSRPGVYGPSEPSQSASIKAPVQEPSVIQNWGWQGVEAMQQDTVMKTLEQNINANRQTFSGMPQAPIDYQSMSSPGMASTAQLPPTDFSGLGRNAELPPGGGNQRQIQMAGFAPSKGSEASAKVLQGVVSLFLPDMSDMPGAENPMDHINRIVTSESVNNFVKSVPKGTANIFIAGACLMLPDMTVMPGAEDPRTHLKMVTRNAMLKYDQVMHIDPNAVSSKAGEFTGEMLAFGGAGKVIKIAEGVIIFGMACEGGMVGLVMAEAHDTNKVAGVAFGFAGGAAVGTFFSRTKPEMKALIDRMKSQPQGFGQQVRAVEGFQQPALRSGVVSEGTVARLTERNVKKVKTSKDVYVPDRDLPRHPIKKGEPLPDVNVPHTQLGMRDGRKGKYAQAREFDVQGKPLRDIDFTDHGRSQNHPNPHQHIYEENPTGGTKSRDNVGKAVPEWRYE